MRAAWNYRSVVMACKDCDGTGEVHSNRIATINDPYPTNPCDCGLGQHEPECEVCGFNQVVGGYDCLVCNTIADLTDRELAQFDPEAFAAAVKVAHAKALADVRKAA
jgi:hypothetical protein